MSVAIATVRRPRSGPALRRLRVPVRGLALSALLHGALVAAVFIAGHVWRANEAQPYVVNLVPAIAAVGSPRGRTVPEPALPKTSDPTATRPAPPPPSLPEREPPRAPDRTKATDLPERAPAPRESVALPDRSLPSRTPTLPRPGEKELPRVASTTPPQSASNPGERAAPPPPLGQVTGSPQGAGARTLSVSDFKYAWYVALVQRKIEEQWGDKSLQGRQPEIVFEIDRTGQVRSSRVSKSSGNPLYDRVALRAIADAAPFPPLPQDFPKPEMSIGMEFSHSPQRQVSP